MLLLAKDDETYCIKTGAHMPVSDGTHKVCYRCGMLLGPADAPDLGSLMDY